MIGLAEKEGLWAKLQMQVATVKYYAVVGSGSRHYFLGKIMKNWTKRIKIMSKKENKEKT